MGLEDREYLREEAKRYGGANGTGGGFGGNRSGAPKRMVTIIVIVCAALYLIDSFTPPVYRSLARDPNAKAVFDNLPADKAEDFLAMRGSAGNQLFDLMALKVQDVFSSKIFSAPWNIYQLLTYGFAHASLSTGNVLHIVFNMLVLWQIGRIVEDQIGRNEFLYFYLAAIIFSGIVFGLLNVAGEQNKTIVGASGGVAAVVVLLAFILPNLKLFLFGVYPLKAWIIGVLMVGIDFVNALMNSSDRVAYEAHIGGAIFAALYFYSKIRFTEFMPTKHVAGLFKSKPKLRVHDPDSDEDEVDENYKRDAKLADEILDKLHREGEESLTRKERKTLERFSKRVRKKRT